jgi:divalent metal cation (Fe/Co/Zn/Cd) transporter
MKSLLIGEAATPDDERRISESLASASRVRRVIHLKTEHIGPEELLVAAKVEFDHELSVHDLADAIDGAESALRDRVPSARIVYLEPDLYRDPA